MDVWEKNRNLVTCTGHAARVELGGQIDMLKSIKSHANLFGKVRANRRFPTLLLRDGLAFIFMISCSQIGFLASYSVAFEYALFAWLYIGWLISRFSSDFLSQ